MIAPWIKAHFPQAEITPLTAGWSDDLKYSIQSSAGRSLLRVSPRQAYARKQEEFAQLARLNAVSTAFPRALDRGCIAASDQCFVRYQWLEGTAAPSVLPALPAEVQFQLGLTAGQLLRTIHDLPQTKVVDAHDYMAGKIKARRQQMRDRQLEFPGYTTMLEYLDRHLDLVADTPTVFRHGDFHLGNMLIDPQGRLVVIDFNRSDFGDPIEDFNRLFTFSRQISVPFARGQLKGYWGDKMPAEFFAHVLCYVLQDCAFGLVWAQLFGAREIAVQHALTAQIMADFAQLKTTRPRWWA